MIAVDEDIDPDNADALWWALAYLCNLALDMQVLHHRDQGHGPSSERNGGEDASVLFDATLKEDFPPVSLPKREYMERARQIWEELGLPPIKRQTPWFGYSFGGWSEELDMLAQHAVRGEHWQSDEDMVAKRRKDVDINTEIKH